MAVYILCKTLRDRGLVKALLSGPGFVVVVSDNGDGSMWFFYVASTKQSLTSNFGS